MEEIDKSEQKFKTVVNAEGHYSIWTESLPIPDGWSQQGVIGSKELCLSQIEKIWRNDFYLNRATSVFDTLNADQCIHRLFEDQALRSPDATAVIAGQHCLTYDRLNRQANRVARQLKAVVSTPGFHVGVCIERCTELVVALLAVFKAGGVYIPLEPGLPDERLKSMTLQCDMRILLTQSTLAVRFAKFQGQVISIDQNHSELKPGPDENLAAGPSSGSLSHIIFTSGSTGKPKGVMMSHASLAGNIKAFLGRLEIRPDDVYLHTASIAFTSSLRQFFAPLSAGATVVIANAEERANPMSLLKLIQEQGVTILDTVAAFWENLNLTIEHLDENSCQALMNNRLRLILSSGGKLPRRIPENWRRQFRHPIQLVNMYGQTETAGNILIYDIPESLYDRLDVVPLGQSINGTQINILDERLNPVPIGVVGEICVGGLSISNGYLHQAALTAEKFVPNPLSRNPGALLYRSGDLGRQLPNGTIEFVGRSDFQVKIRGFRIELGEIEAMLAKLDEVRQCAVAVRADRPGDQRLVAYYVPEGIAEVSTSDWRNYLRTQLPDYMVPQHFVKLEAMPLTPNGKVDRNVLPKPEMETVSDRDYVAPRTDMERQIAVIWQEVLRQGQVGVYEDFFELGGHSLLATQVLSRINRQFDMQLPLRRLFDARTVEALAEVVGTFLASSTISDLAPISRVERTEAIPASFSQERLWFLNQLEPESVAYKVPGGHRLTGILRLDILEQSLTEIVRRHEVLRTTFSQIDGTPVQVIAPPSVFNLEVVDLQEYSAEEREKMAQLMATEEARRAFDLSTGPLFRAVLVRLAENEHILLLTMHHIITDGWSFGVFWRELGSLYAAFSKGQPSPLSELPIQYADFAVWQRQWLQGEVLETQVEYWKKQLGGELPVLQLPTDRPRPAMQSYRGAKHQFAMPAVLAEGLKQLSRRQGVTLFMTLLAAFKVLLFRYTGQTNFSVGSPIANRTRTELEGLIGFFVNTLVLRTDLSEDPRFLEFLGKVKETTLGAFAHQDTPFEKLVEVINPARDMSHSPLFQVMFAFQNMPRATAEFTGLTLTPMTIDTGTSMFDLSLSMREEAEGLVGEFEYNTDLFDQDTIVRMVNHLKKLIESIVANPELSLSELPILTASERHQLLVDWNDTACDYPRNMCIHELFEERVELAPESMAVIFEGEQLSYRELNRRANSLAHRLKILGVAAETRVGICIERSVDLVVGLLGILKSGGAYVPLDPIYPKERMAFMLEDSQTSILVTQKNLVSNFAAYEGKIISLDTDRETPPREWQENLVKETRAENLAYIIYTSGSTGKPKGVLIHHQALVNHSHAVSKYYNIQTHDRILQFASFSFDVAAEELYPSLIKGATVVLRGEDSVLAFNDFLQFVNKNELSVLNLPASFWHELVFWLYQTQMNFSPSVRLVIVGSDLALTERLLTWKLLVGEKIRLLNAYGPTECTITATLYDATLNGENLQGYSIPIGRPIDNTSTYVLDSHLEPVPIGVAGELYIGGEGLARGYLNRPELTAERFFPDPFSKKPEARLYKTGDRARYLADGNIEFLGRVDNQVKVRGFRIELGEIEAALRTLPSVHDAIVMTREFGSGDKRLVAYLIVEELAGSITTELRNCLKEKLPDYMVPSVFVALNSFLLMPNGKVDRKALPAPTDLRKIEEEYVAPQTGLEETIASIWKEEIGLEKVGIHDNFFDLGGHSLLLVRVHNKLRGLVEESISIITLFQYPTISSLCNYLNREKDERSFIKQLRSRTQRQEQAMIMQRQMSKVKRKTRE